MDEGHIVMWEPRANTFMFLLPSSELCICLCVRFLVEEIYYKWSVFGVVGVLDEEDCLCDEIRTEGNDVA